MQWYGHRRTTGCIIERRGRQFMADQLAEGFDAVRVLGIQGAQRQRRVTQGGTEDQVVVLEKAPNLRLSRWICSTASA